MKDENGLCPSGSLYVLIFVLTPLYFSVFTVSSLSAALVIVSDVADQANDSLKHGVSFKCEDKCL